VTYQESVRYLYSLGNEVKTMKLGLDRIAAVLAALDHPERAYPIVHVAGTNGKGSVCAMIDAGVRAAGTRCGLFTSPHLLEPTERIQIAGRPVSREQFAAAFQVVHAAAQRLDLDCHPTYFESVTAMALWLFREARVDLAVLETGLGGRLDATNAVQPALTVITAIDFDHQAYLGNTIAAIAGEKAGILKPGVPAVFAPQRPEAMAVLEARACEVGAPVIRAAGDPPRQVALHARGSTFCLSQGALIHCPLAGEHQIDNAVTAALALRALGVPPEGIAETRWPGRIEHVAPNPDVILDGAHNPAGASALARYLRRFYGDRRIWMIFGAMSDKAVAETAAILFPLAAELVFAAPRSPRSMAPADLLALAGRGRAKPGAASAVQYALSNALPDDVIVITGSLYLVGEARALFLENPGGRW
jgi:dihydrofolate synthase/folylpolyglutamate synthase